MQLLKKGKVKDIFELDENQILFEFTDRISAFDIILPDIIPYKGEVLCRFAEYWFNTLKIPNHMLKVIPPKQMVVKKLDLIPIECIIRGYLYGSLYERVHNKEVNLESDILAIKLSKPYFDPTTKFEAKDRPITIKEILDKKWLSIQDLEWLKTESIRIYLSIADQAEKAGFILADIKLEFGYSKDKKILLADSIGPDEFRLWPKDNYQVGKSQESYDKQPIRDWLIKVEYKKSLDEARKTNSPIPPPPALPKDLISEISERYIYAYEKLTGKEF